LHKSLINNYETIALLTYTQLYSAVIQAVRSSTSACLMRINSTQLISLFGTKADINARETALILISQQLYDVVFPVLVTGTKRSELSGTYYGRKSSSTPSRELQNRFTYSLPTVGAWR